MSYETLHDNSSKKTHNLNISLIIQAYKPILLQGKKKTPFTLMPSMCSIK